MTQLDVRIDAAGCVLAGTYAEVPNPVAAALLITGSGQTDRNSDARLPGGRKLRAGITQAVAEAVDAVRVCTLRFDKRGVGASGGDYLKVGMDQRAADARDWLAAKTEGLAERLPTTTKLTDPAQVLARITVPVLAITGAHDLQVPPEDVAAMSRLVRGPFEGHVVPDLSHLLRPDPGSLGPRGYRQQTRQPVSPVVLQLITTWLCRNWGQA
ncbi:MAG: alpha/beta hydrolase [Actinobacteria bacterium]|nr:alpha/beta hydrolase [Actinomycetota bacterium]